jgi:hypothetical protein
LAPHPGNSGLRRHSAEYVRRSRVAEHGRVAADHPPDAFPLRVRLPKGTAGLSADSDILVDQILAWDNDLFRRDLGELPESLQDDVRRAVSEFLDLSSLGYAAADPEDDQLPVLP